jgi:hypothetical protein
MNEESVVHFKISIYIEIGTDVLELNDVIFEFAVYDVCLQIFAKHTHACKTSNCAGKRAKYFKLMGSCKGIGII